MGTYKGVYKGIQGLGLLPNSFFFVFGKGLYYVAHKRARYNPDP